MTRSSATGANMPSTWYFRYFWDSNPRLFMAIGPMDWAYCEMYVVNAYSIPAHKLNEVDQWGGSCSVVLYAT